jgi:hypothetical protein
MNKQTLKKFRLFWAWQDEKEEAWLREMAKQGWHLQSFSGPGIYNFQQGEAKNIIYRMDFRTMTKQDMQEYLQIFHDAGWEYIGDLSSWQYFRKEVKPGEEMEILTDAESKIAKYQRLLALLVVFLPILLIFNNRLNQNEGSLIIDIARFAVFLLILLFIYSVVMILRRISQLKRL